MIHSDSQYFDASFATNLELPLGVVDSGGKHIALKEIPSGQTSEAKVCVIEEGPTCRRGLLVDDQFIPVELPLYFREGDRLKFTLANSGDAPILQVSEASFRCKEDSSDEATAYSQGDVAESGGPHGGVFVYSVSKLLATFLSKACDKAVWFLGGVAGLIQNARTIMSDCVTPKRTGAMLKTSRKSPLELPECSRQQSVQLLSCSARNLQLSLEQRENEADLALISGIKTLERTLIKLGTKPLPTTKAKQILENEAVRLYPHFEVVQCADKTAATQYLPALPRPDVRLLRILLLQIASIAGNPERYLDY